MKKIVALGFAVSVFAAACGGAIAAPACGPREKIVAAIGQAYQENRQALGLAGQAAVVELFVSGEGTWTLTATDTRGQTCVIAAGQAWQAAPKQLAGLSS